MSVIENAKRFIFGPSPCPRWDKALADSSFFILAEALAKTLPQAEFFDFVTPKNQKSYHALSKHMIGNRCGVNALENGESIFVVVANDQFFEGPMAVSLQSQGWSDRDIAQLALLHEFAHGCVGQKAATAGEMQHETITSIKIWKSAFYAWPLTKSARCPTLSIKSVCQLMHDFSPSGRLAHVATSTRKRDEIIWAANLEELRADGLSIAVCAASQNPLFKSHPFRVNFSAALDQLEKARGGGANKGAYRWGRFREAALHIGSPAVTATSTAIAIAECAALMAANSNAPFLAAQPAVPTLALNEMTSYFHPDPQKTADDQFNAALALLSSIFPLTMASPPSRAPSSPLPSPNR